MPINAKTLARCLAPTARATPADASEPIGAGVSRAGAAGGDGPRDLGPASIRLLRTDDAASLQ